MVSAWSTPGEKAAVRLPKLSPVRMKVLLVACANRHASEAVIAVETWSIALSQESPLLPDADRKGISLGASIALSAKTRLDISYLYLRFSDRSTEGGDPDGYNGTYKTTANLLGFTLVHTF
jgi:hypothetical protein